MIADDIDIQAIKKAAEKAFGEWEKYKNGEIKAKYHGNGFFIPCWRVKGISCSMGGQTQLITKEHALDFAKKEIDKLDV